MEVVSEPETINVELILETIAWAGNKYVSPGIFDAEVDLLRKHIAQLAEKHAAAVALADAAVALDVAWSDHQVALNAPGDGDPEVIDPVVAAHVNALSIHDEALAVYRQVTK